MTEGAFTDAAKAAEAVFLAVAEQHLHKMLRRRHAILHIPLFFAKHVWPQLLKQKRIASHSGDSGATAAEEAATFYVRCGHQQHQSQLPPVHSQLRCAQQHCLDFFFFLILSGFSTVSFSLATTSRFVSSPTVSIPAVTGTVSIPAVTGNGSVTRVPLIFANS